MSLIRTLEGNLLKAGQGRPAEISNLQQLAESFARYEVGSPERFRYAYVEKFSNGNAPPPGFPEKVSVPVQTLQRELEDAYLACGDIDNPQSLWRRLYSEAGSMMQAAIESGRVALDDGAE